MMMKIRGLGKEVIEVRWIEALVNRQLAVKRI
jgi:hypothetical protein